VESFNDSYLATEVLAPPPPQQKKICYAALKMSSWKIDLKKCSQLNQYLQLKVEDLPIFFSTASKVNPFLHPTQNDL
jgi:hypothetical protein